MNLKTRKNNWLNIVLIIVMIMTLFPSATSVTYGETQDEVVESPAIDLDGECYSFGNKVWFGGSDEPLISSWQVLDSSADGKILLLSDQVLGSIQYNKTPNGISSWQGSDAQKWCGDFYASSNFSDIERSVILSTSKDADVDKGNGYYNMALNGEYVFFLSASEIVNYLTKDSSNNMLPSGTNLKYWTRSTNRAGTTGDIWYVTPNLADPKHGVIGTLVGSSRCGTRPAFNLDYTKILFSTAAENGKQSGEIGVDSLTPVGTNSTGEWKVTLKDPSRASFSAAVADTDALINSDNYSNWTVPVNWDNAKTGDKEYVSALLIKGDSIEAANREVLYYGNIAQNAESAEKQQITIPEGLEAGDYTLLIFNEQKNGDKLTDYASDFVSFPLKVAHDLTYVPAQAAACVSPGNTAYYSCACGKYFSDEEAANEIEKDSWIVPVDPNAHDEEFIITPATLTRNGSVLKKCKICGEELDNTLIYAPTEIRLEQDMFDYTGGAIEPAVSVVDSNGDTVDSKHYTVSYSDNVNAGEATVTVAFDGSYYTGTKELPFQINAPKNGWQQEDGYWYYYDDGNRVTNAWKKDSKGWRYLGADGTTVANGWVKASKGWCWLDANGYWASNRWVKDKDSWYYIKSDGYMAANQWVKASGGWCYVSASGRMVANGWVKDSKGWCWMGSDGYWVKNRWVKDKGLWYYINSSGYMAANQWVKSGGHWYYMKANGVMAYSEWVQSSGQWYYLKADGIMATGTQTIGGRTYRFDSSGRWIK